MTNDSTSVSASAPAELRYVEVLASTYPDGADVEDQNLFSVSGAGSNAATDDILATVTLCVNARQAALLAGLEENATLHAALVVRGDADRKAEVLKMQNEILAQLAADGEEVP